MLHFQIVASSLCGTNRTVSNGQRPSCVYPSITLGSLCSSLSSIDHMLPTTLEFNLAVSHMAKPQRRTVSRAQVLGELQWEYHRSRLAIWTRPDLNSVVYTIIAVSAKVFTDV